MPEYGRSWAEVPWHRFHHRGTARHRRRPSGGSRCAGSSPAAPDHRRHRYRHDRRLGDHAARPRDPLLSAIPATGDLYLLFRPDTPWINDGTRMFGGDQRTRFHTVVRDELSIRRITPVIIDGDWATRRATAETAITALLTKR